MMPHDFKPLHCLLSTPDALVLDVDNYEAYHHDATDYRGRPAAIVFATCEQDVIETVRFCAEHEIPLVGRGAGTGLSGGCVPTMGELVLSTERMTELCVDPVWRIAVCGPGVITKHLQDEALKFNFAYPPDPASYTESTLGGNIAENAGGLRCKRFGVTRDYVIGLRGILADGRVLDTGIFNRNGGFNFTDLLIASEGTLVITTRIAVRLVPACGRGTTILAAFDTPEQAAQTVSDITGAGIIPMVLEYVDGDAASVANAYKHTEGIDKAAAVLLIETTELDPEGETARIRRFCEGNQAAYVRAEADPERAEVLWDVRRNISTALKAMAAIRISEDVAVPNSRFPDLVAYVSELNAASSIRINSYGHAGDGNLHVNFISMTGSDGDREEIERRIGELMRRTIELGGTLSGEHGIGLAKRQFIGLEFDDSTLEAMREFKRIFDPSSTFGPGKILEI